MTEAGSVGAEGATTPPVEVGTTLSDRIKFLLEHTRQPDGAPMTIRRLADAVEARTGSAIGSSTVHKLLTGASTNPRLDTLAALGAFWGVPLSFFVGTPAEAEAIWAQVEVLQALENADIRQLAVRAEGLSTESLQLISTLVEQARRAEGLNAPPAKAYRARRRPGQTA